MDESFRQLLPLLRPRSESGLYAAVVLVLLVLVLVTGLITYLTAQRWLRRASARAFRSAAGERGLTPSQIDLLADMARHGKLRNPLLLLSSLRTFDRQAASVAEKATDGSEENRRRLRELTAIRAALGFDRSRPSQPLHNTRTIAPGQVLMVWPVAGDIEGFIHCGVVHRDDSAIEAVPLLRQHDVHLSHLETGDPIKVRFWRGGDTEYRFRTQILAAHPKTTSILIKHSETVERVQKRDYFRIRANVKVVFHTVRRADYDAGRDCPMSGPRESIVGTVVDLSAGGMSALLESAPPGDCLLIVDGSYCGPFALGGVACEIVDQSPGARGCEVRLRYVDLPVNVQDDLVAQLYREQLERAAM